MATLLTTTDLSKTYGTHTLFRGVGLTIADGDRIGLIGPNGAGKSTLLKLVAGLEVADEGEITRRRSLRAAYVAQDDTFEDGATPMSVTVARVHAADAGAGHASTDAMDAETRAAITLSRLGFAEAQLTTDAATLSGGWRKRLSIAAAVATDADVLLLDEPTNHLDLDGVRWLERFAKQSEAALAFITHDRAFLEAAANRIVELSRAYPDGTFEVKGNYSAFVRRKAEYLDGLASQRTALAGKVRRDDAWLRQGIKGRQTRNKTQVADASDRREQLGAIGGHLAAPTKTTAIDFQATERKTRQLLSAHRVAKSLGGKALFSGLDVALAPGERLGLLGPNGAGKTTLLRVLTGELEPDSGTVKPAADLRVVYFSQARGSLDASATLRQALCPVGDVVHYRGKELHVAAWAKKFLFDPTRFNVSVGDLSGGERARVLIAGLMLQPADVLILDEPTNDLDIPSLEVLEATLLEFPGAVVLVTHDRFMLQRLATRVLALDGEGGAKHHASYEQWLDAAARAEAVPAAKAQAGEKPVARRRADAKPKKLTFKLQRELDGMEDAILAGEAAVEALTEQAGDPAVIADHATHAAVCERLGAAQQAVQGLYERWAELEAMTG